MDERHWWITSKILLTYQNNILVNPGFVEEFMTDSSTLDILNEYFQQEGPQIFFLYMDKNALETSNSKDVKLKLSSLILEDLNHISTIDNILGMYFLKKRKEEITITNIETEVLCGEMKLGAFPAYCDLLRNAVCPMLLSSTNIGTNVEGAVEYFNEVTKYSEILMEFSNGMETSEQILKIPKEHSIGDFRKNRQFALNPLILSEYEGIVVDWIEAIESVLLDNMDESEQNLYVLPKNMLIKWHRRLKTIQSIMDQLKLKQCKTVIAILITAKAKTMKKWKIIDAGLTDVFNDAKDKVKFLESLKKFFEPNKESMSNIFLPDLLSTLRHMDSVSRYFARTGFLGSLFAKFSYLIVSHCYESIKDTLKSRPTTLLWEAIFSEILEGELKTERMKVKRKITNSTGFMSVLHNVISIIGQYNDVYYVLKDTYGNYTQQPISAVQSFSRRLKQGNNQNEYSSASIEKMTDSGYSFQPGAYSIEGVSFKDDNIILHPVKIFSNRIQRLIDIIETMKQFHHLILASKTLPLLDGKESKKQKQFNMDNDCFVEEGSSDLDLSDIVNKIVKKPLKQTLAATRGLVYMQNDTVEVDVKFTKFSFSGHLQQLFNVLSSYLKKELSLAIFYDPEKNNDVKFDEIYVCYVKNIKELESVVESYVKGAFTMNWNTLKMLEILKSFHSVITRTSLQPLFKKKYNEALSSFEKDLESIGNIYEKQKENPPMVRNLPAISSSVIWSRTLYNKIEKPMKMLSVVKIATEMKRYSTVVRNYNKLATILLCFEENWVSLWRSETEQVIPKLLDLTLLAQNSKDNNKIIVYANPRMMEVFSDIRALKRLGIKIPSDVASVCHQESKFKFYYHILEFYVQRYYHLRDHIPNHFASIMKPLHESTLAYFQPGLSVLKWHSVNVDGFLYKLKKAIEAFEDINAKICNMVNKIDRSIEELKSIILFKELEFCRDVWTTSEFILIAKESIKAIGNVLDSHIRSIERTLKEIVLTITCPPEASSKVSSPISSSNERKVASYLFSFYASQVYTIIMNAVKTSLTKYYHCCTTDNEMDNRHFRFHVSIVFRLPVVVLSPSLMDVQSAVSSVAQEMIDITSNIRWWDENTKKSFQQAVSTNENIITIKQQIDTSIKGIENQMDCALLVFDQFNFLWLNDMNSLYKTFEEEKPDVSIQHEELQRLLTIEGKIKAIENEMIIEGIVLDSSPIKDSLLGFCVAWKMCYVHNLHNIAETALKDIVQQQDVFFVHLNKDITSLDELNKVIGEAEHILDMDSQIDDLYLPVETLYWKLTTSYGIPLSREELKTVGSLRDKWKELLTLAEKVTKKLVQEQRSVFEQELDKQVKEFVVAVIQFRNSFDSQGPGIPGIVPNEAVSRLKDFQGKYHTFEENMKTLHSVQKLYGIMPTPFDELEKTGKELQMLGMLYEIYQDFLKFDNKFRDTLWADVNLADNFTQVKNLHEKCIGLPSTIHGWFAYKKLKESITDYRQIFPILHKLASKEIRNRHWLQVMHVTKRSFQLEANIFKLQHILDIGLKEHKEAIEQILLSSKAELELEIKLRQIEEEWTEQIVKFQSFKSRGFVVFDKERMNHLLDSLEESKTTLSSMLTSKHVTPLREEAAVWSLKLNEVSEVLEEWLVVEELWINLEAVFSYENTVKQLPEQSNSFVKADRSYMKLMKKTAESANVLQCCLGGEISKVLTLKQIYRELETCFSSLKEYLNNKRKIFPRFHFVSDDVLLSMLSKRHSIESVLPYIREVIIGIDKLETVAEQSSTCAPTPTEALPVERLGNLLIEMPSKQVARKKFSISLNQRDRYSSIHSSFDNRSSKRGSSIMDYLSDSDSAKAPDTSITSVIGLFGEKLILRNQILLDGQVEGWINKVLSESRNAVNCEMFDCIENLDGGMVLEDSVLKFPCQVALMGFFYFWTKECEKAIQDIRIDRKAFTMLSKRFLGLINRLTQLLTRGTAKSCSSPLTDVQRIRLQCIIAFGLYAFDAIDRLTSNKLRDITDYDWQQTLRCYMRPINETCCEKKLVLEMFDNTFQYRNEFLGCHLTSIMTISSEKVMLNLVLALAQRKASCISGDVLVGKSVLINCFAILFGEHCVTIDCLSPLTLNSLKHLFLGICADGSWCMFRDFNELPKEHLKLMQYCLSTIHDSVQRKSQQIQFEGFSPVNIHPHCGVFLTTSLSYIHEKCPASLKMNLRNTSINHPNLMTVLKIQLVANGFKSSKALAYNMKLVVDIAKEQIKLKWNFGLAVLRSIIERAAMKQQHVGSIDRIPDIHVPKMHVVQSINTFAQQPGNQQTMKNPNISSVASETVKIEFSLIANSMIEMVDARLADDESLLFKNIVQSVFVGHADSLIHVSIKKEQLLEEIITNVLQEKLFSTHKPFVSKILQLYKLSQVHHGIILCGGSQNGKSTIVSTLMESLRRLTSQTSKDSSLSYKHEHINVLAVTSLDQMFGYMNSANEWVDGIFTTVMKKSNQQLTTHKLSTWITLDGPLRDGWCLYLESLINESKVFVQPDLKRHYLNNHVKILCETDSLANSSPSCIAHMGILYVDNSVLGWRPIADAWLVVQNPSYFHTLQRAFHKTVDRVFQFIQDEAQCCIKLSECAVFSSCLSLLSSMLNEHSDSLAGDVHVERLYLFSLIWIFGGLLVHDKERKQFNLLLLSLSNTLPDDDREISVFDYYVDESGEWDTWCSRLCDYHCAESIDVFGEVFIENVLTYRTKFLMSQYLETGGNILLMGPSGAGKTRLIQDLMKKVVNKMETSKLVTFSFSTDASFLQQFIENNLHHRQGFIYGAKNNKNLKIFIDDIHLPDSDLCGTQSVNQLLRQVLDRKVIFSHSNKQCKHKTIEGLNVLAAMNSNSPLCKGKTSDISRLMGMFGVLYLPTPDEKQLLSMTSSLLEANMTYNQGLSLPSHMHTLIVETSTKMICYVSKYLFSHSTNPPSNYLFNIGDLSVVFRMLQRCPEEARADDDGHYLLNFWFHEIRRSFYDRILTSSDMELFDNLFEKYVQEYFDNNKVELEDSVFTTFTTDSHLRMHRPAMMEKRKVLNHQCLASIEDVDQCISAYVNAFSNDKGEQMDVVWHSFHKLQLIKFHRVLSQETRGNMIVVASAVEHMKSITRLVSFMLNYHYVEMNCSSIEMFLKKLRMAVRTAGCENKQVTICIKSSNICDMKCLDSLNSVMSLGEYNSLFSDTEMHGLLVALRPKIKKSYSRYIGNPIQFFTKCVLKNLHVVMFVTPKESFLDDVERMYPGILFNSHVNFVADDSQEYLHDESVVAINDTVLSSICEEKGKLIQTLQGIHLKFINRHRDEKSLGILDKDEEINVIKKKILSVVQNACATSEEVNVLTFNKFLRCFNYVLEQKVIDIQTKTKLRSDALSCLEAAEERYSNIQTMKTNLQNEYKIIVNKVSTLLDELFDKSSLIERLKAKLSVGNSNFRALMCLIDNELMEGEEEFSWEEEHDELDEEYDRIQSSSQQRMKSLDDKIAEAERLLEKQEQEMNMAKELLQTYQVKIDRACIEKLRAYQSPPTLVGTIMIMLMILLGRPEFSQYIVKETKTEKKSDGFFNVSDSGTKNNLESGTRCGSAKSRVTKDLKSNLGPDGRVDKTVWKTIQLIMQDSQKFCEFMNNYNWCKGVSNDVLHTVVMFFAPGEEIPLSARTQNNRTTSQKDERVSGISLQAARYSSEDAAQIVEYVQLVIQFTRKYKPYHRTMQVLKSLKAEKKEEEEGMLKIENPNNEDEKKVEENEEDLMEDLTEEDLSRLQDELCELEKEFDVCTIKKHKLKEKIQKLQHLSDSTAEVLERFLDLKFEWQEYYFKCSTNKHLLANVIVAATFLSYCGTIGVDERKQLMREVVRYCEDNGFEQGPEALFTHQSLFSFLLDKFEEKQLEWKHVPRDGSCTELACFLKIGGECLDGWPLLCDPHHIGVFLVKEIFPNITMLHYENFEDEIEEALVTGMHVLVTDVTLESISENKKLKPVLQSYHMFGKSSSIKLIIGQKELDCSTNFRMILATSTDGEKTPALENLVPLNVPVSRDMLFQIFLEFFIKKEKSQLHDAITKTNQEILDKMKLMQKLECELLHLLSNKDCFDDIVSIQKILAIKKQFDESMSSKARAEEVFHSIKTSEESYTPIAQQASVLFHVDTCMRNVNSLYNISIHRFLHYFATAVKHSDRVAVSVTVERVLASIFHILSKAKLEKDRPLFALMVAIETEDIHERVAIGDREFLINARLGAAVKQYHLECLNNQISPPKSSIKKPFDWMSDTQYQHLLILSQNYDWFSETFDKMAKDGREMQWRQISEHDTPELLSLPDNLDERYSPLKRFLVIKSFRPDRFMHAAEVFIRMTLGKQFAHDPVLDLKTISHQSPSSIPILLLYDQDAFLSFYLLQCLADLKQVYLHRIVMTGQKSNEEDVKMMTKAMTQGWWLLLEDIHNNTQLLSKLLVWTKKQKADSSFRLWLSADINNNTNLIRTFHSCSPIVIDAPKLSLHASFVQNFHLVDSNIWKASIRHEWLPSLHNMCMLHASLLQRLHCGCVQEPHSFQVDVLKFFELLELMKNLIIKEIEQQGGNNEKSLSLKNLPWPSIKQIIYKVVYGRDVTSSTDSRVLSAIIDYWMSSAATRKDFEVGRVRYKLPAAIFSSLPKTGNILQAIDSMATSTLASSEFCGLFHATEAMSTPISYCINNFKLLVDKLPESHSVYHPDASIAFEKDMDMGLLYSRSLNAYVSTYTMMAQFRQLELTDVISNVLGKLPKLWNKDFVSERIRRTGGVNAFNMWLLCEADEMSLLHYTIKSTLMEAKDFLDDSKDIQISQSTISVLLDLYNGSVPAKWMKHAGNSAPPSTWNIMSWISDFHNRCSHIEKILIQGRDKMAGYWLAAFFNPKRLISVVMQESLQMHQHFLTRGEQLVIKTEITTRDKDHLRDPPSDGIFLYGLSLWGTSWEKATNELHDAPPKATYYSLPVLHVQLVPASTCSATYTCPCYVSRTQLSEEILGVDIDQKDVNPLKWSLRGLTCTLRPF